MLQEAIGGIEGEMRVCLQYLFQAWSSRVPDKYRDMLLDTGTEEIAHIEMLATAVTKNLKGASDDLKEKMGNENTAVEAIMGGLQSASCFNAGSGSDGG